MYSAKSPGLKYCETNRSVLKYRSCFNRESEIEIDRSAMEDAYRTQSSPKGHADNDIQVLPSDQENQDDISVPDVPRPLELLKNEDTSHKDMRGYVGFANLPNQVHRIALRKGFELTIMIVGQSGLGKSTLINSLFHTEIYGTEYPGPTSRAKKTMSIEATKVTLKENGVNLCLTVVDTPGFGDAVDNTNCWTPIIQFIESKYESYLQSETRVNRTVIRDTRVHCCLFCIQATGHSLKPLDIEFMKRLSDKVNIVPVITKADMLTSEESDVFKKQILREIKEHNINIYDFPKLSEEDSQYELNEILRKKVPFAVVGSNSVLEVGGKRFRARQYHWGIIEIENEDHCDFMALKRMLIHTHLEDLRSVTHNVHYERYRCNALSKIIGKEVESIMDINKQGDSLQKLETELKKELDRKLQRSIERLKGIEMELKTQVEVIERGVKQRRKELEDDRKLFELEKAAWEKKWVSLR